MTNAYPPRHDQFCGNCMFHMRGRCRRHAPEAPAIHGDRTVWPVVDVSDWCGEWLTLEERA